MANQVGLKAEEKGVELMFNLLPDISTALIGDSLRLGQILINLGNNAVKFTEKGGEIVISVDVREQTDDNVTMHFAVRDSGIGLTPEQQAKLFQSFSQADASTTRKYGGTGLGLAICKKLSELMNGEIWVASEAGKGSSFEFTAVFGLQKGEVSNRRSLDNDLGALRVLVVDDNASSREILSSMLASYGLRVDQAGTGESAIALLIDSDKKDPYKLVLMDWQMPGIDGIETTRAIQQNNQISEIPTVIMLTAYGREEACQAAEGVNIMSFLTKPVTSSGLLDAIMLAMGREVSTNNRSLNRQDEARDDIAKLRGAYVLLVEDNEINQELALELLTTNGILAEIADDGQQALDWLKAQEFDGILMDIQMPVMDGYTATRNIRALEKYANLPIIAMTANAMVGDKEKVLDAGMNDHIAKPINVAEMFRTMAKWITPSKPNTAFNEEKKKEDVEIPDLEGVNTEDGLARTQGNTKLYLKLLKKVRESQKDFIIDFTMACDEADWELAERLAHTLKGVAGNVGASRVQKCCDVLEKQSTEEQVSQTDIQEAENALNIVLTSLATLPDSPASNATSTQNFEKEALENLLTGVIQQLEEFDTEALNTIEENRELFSVDFLIDQYNALEKALGGYDFEVASSIAKDMHSSVQMAGSDEGPAAIDVNKLMEVFKSLNELLAEYNTDAKDFLEDNEAWFEQSGIIDEFEKMLKSLDMYDFTEAAAVLKKLAEKFQIEL